MRGDDSYNESLFSSVRLEDFVPANHPLRPIRIWMNDPWPGWTSRGQGAAVGRRLSVDGTQIKAWAGHKRVRREDGSDDGLAPEDWRGEPRSNDTHASTSDPDALLYRKSKAAPALPSVLGM